MPNAHPVLVGAPLLALTTLYFAQPRAPRLTPVATIGCESCTGPALFTRIGALSIGVGGEIIVADNSPPVIRTFDAGGRAGTAFGRLGDGPGEMRSPIAIAMHGDRSFSIVDLGRRALLRMDSAGRDRETIALGGFPTSASFGPRGTVTLVGVTAPRSPGLRILRVGADNNTTEALTVGTTEFPQRGAGNPAGMSIALAADGSFAVGDGAGEYLVRRYSAAGAFVGEIRRTVAKVKRTEAELLELAQRRAGELAKMQQMTGRAGPAPAVSTAGIPVERNYFDAYAMQFDEQGRLWVRVERAPPGSTLFDVFDARGSFLGEVKVDGAIRDFALGSGLFACVTRSNNGAELVMVWKVD